MTDEERDIMLQEVHLAVLGIKGTAQRGMAGDMKDMKETIGTMCDDHDKLKSVVYGLIWFLAGAGVLTGTGIGISKLIAMGVRF